MHTCSLDGAVRKKTVLAQLHQCRDTRARTHTLTCPRGKGFRQSQHAVEILHKDLKQFDVPLTYVGVKAGSMIGKKNVPKRERFVQREKRSPA